MTEVGEIFDFNSADYICLCGWNDKVRRRYRALYALRFSMYFATRDVLANGKPMTELAEVLAEDELYPHPERLLPFLGNRDTSRFAEVVADPNARALAFAFLMTTRGMPQIYSGDEIAMKGGWHPDNRQDFPGGFVAATSGTMENACSSDGRRAEQQALYSWIRQLTTLRREHPVLACGAEQVLASGPDLLVYARYGLKGCADIAGTVAPEQLLVVLERGPQAPVNLDLHDTALAAYTAKTPLSGVAKVMMKDHQLTPIPNTPFVLVPFQ